MWSKLRGLHGDADSLICPGPDIAKPTGGAYLMRNLDITNDHHAVWQSSISFSEPPQREQESTLFCGFEVVLSDTLEIM